jgi:hypothetical protein
MTQLNQCCVNTITKADAIGFTSFGCLQCHRNFEILPEQTEQQETPTAILQETCDHDWEDVTSLVHWWSRKGSGRWIGKARCADLGRLV